MNRTRTFPIRLGLVLCALAAAGCSWSDVPAPALSDVSPGSATHGVTVVLAVRGAGFEPEVEVDFDDPERSPVCAAFRVELVAGGIAYPLEEVYRVSASELRGRIPANLPRSAFDVHVVDPRGNAATLPAGFTTIKCLPPGSDCDAKNSCTLDPLLTDKCTGADRCTPGPAKPDGSPCDYPCPAGPVAGGCTAGSCVPSPGACPASAAACGGS